VDLPDTQTVGHSRIGSDTAADVWKWSAGGNQHIDGVWGWQAPVVESRGGACTRCFSGGRCQSSGSSRSVASSP